MTIKSENGLHFEAFDHNGKLIAKMVYTSTDYIEAELTEYKTFILSKVNQHVWITVFKDLELDKLIASTKIDDQNVFTINTFYGRNKYFVKHDVNTDKIVITDNKKSVMAYLLRTKSETDKTIVFKTEKKSDYNLKGDWFLLLHAVHCALYLMNQSDHLFYQSLGR